ncbi:8-oxo-dGTP diphosphatase MutT [Salmonella enterica subsp. enterica]|nr:8-oxo-dGTP diphosphatase MutT [Salmonella enterica subsp. enterica]
MQQDEKELCKSVGIIRNPNDERIFIADAPLMRIAANWLEFPGGKIEADETPERALIRELQEEVGITPTQVTLFDTLEYQFPDRHITLWFWLVERWEGEPWGRRAAGTIGSRAVEFDTDDFRGNEPIIRKLRQFEKPRVGDRSTIPIDNY